MNSSWGIGMKPTAPPKYSKFSTREEYRKIRAQVFQLRNATLDYQGTLGGIYTDEIIVFDNGLYLQARPLKNCQARSFAEALATSHEETTAYAVTLISNGELVNFVIESRMRTVTKNFLEALAVLAKSVIFSRMNAAPFAEKSAARVGVKMSLRDYPDLPSNAKPEAVCDL